MTITALSTTFVTDKVAESLAFYVNNFGGRVEFDNGWYASVVLAEGCSLQFMAPQGPDQKPASGRGLHHNLRVDDVDAEYDRVKGLGLPITMDLEDHPWGDRAFAIMDPNGVTLYIYTETEPSEEFKTFFK